MVLSSVDIKKNIILVILDFHSKIDNYQSKYRISNKQAIEILSVANEINKIIDALELGQELTSKGLKAPRINNNEYEKLKRVLDLTFRYKTDLNAVAMDIGEKLSHSNQLLQAGVDYIFRNLQGKKFEKIAREEFSKKEQVSGETTVRKTKKSPVGKKKSTGFIAQLLFIAILAAGGYYLYNSIFNKHATEVSSLVKEYRSDKKLSETSRPVTTKTIKVAGSSYIISAILKWKDNFLASYKDLSVEIENIDSGVAISKLLDGEINIAATSRIPNLSERKKSQKMGRLFADHKVAMDAVAIFVHPSNPIKELSVEELKEIYTDEDEWREFGGSVTKITKYSPSPQSGTFDFFRDRVMFHEEYDSEVIKMIDVKQMIQMIENDPSGIGFASVSNLIGKKVKILAITTFLNEDRGVSPLQNGEINKTVIKNGEYPLTRYLYLITSGELDDSAAKFIDYFRSEEGQRALDSVGLVSIY